MTKYINVTDLTTVIPAANAVWQAANTQQVSIPTDLAPLTFDQELTPVAVLQKLYTEFLPDLDQAQMTTAVETATQAIFKDKALSQFVTPDYTEVDHPQTQFNFSELFNSPTMTSADLATLAITHLAATTQTFVATDPELLISLGQTLLADQKLIGIYDERQLPTILKTELAELQGHDNVALYLDDQPTVAANHLLTSHPEYRLIDQTVLLTQIPLIAALVNLTNQAQSDAVNLVIPGTKLNAVLAALYARQLGLPIAKIIVAVAAESDLAAFINGEATELAPEIKVNLQRLAALVADKAVNTDAEIVTALQRTDILDFVPVDRAEVAAEIRFLQTKLDYTAGLETALTTLAVPEVTAAATENVVLALIDPYVTPETILRGLTGRNDGKTGFEAVQILRQIVGAKPARLITHLKGVKAVETPKFAEQDFK